MKPGKIVPGENLMQSSVKKARRDRGIYQEAEKNRKILVDGRGAKVNGKENGTHVGPTVTDYVTQDMSVAKEEIFGPVISIMRTKNRRRSLAIENANPTGNASVFTQNGGMARYIIDRASAGIGVNVGRLFRGNPSRSAVGMKASSGWGYHRKEFHCSGPN